MTRRETGPSVAAPAVPVLAVVGVGLIGGSFAAALRRAGQVGRVVGVGRHAGTLERARELGLIDAIGSLEDAARADLVLLAAPVGAMESLLAGLRPHLRPDTVVTDAGSTKHEVVQAARRALGAQVGQFVPGHPIAGSDATGPDAASADLYRGRTVILTPLPENGDAGPARVRQAWEACGAQVRAMDPAEHDCALAAVSHLPHWLAALYMLYVAECPDAGRRLELAGSGFRDFTRIAGGSPEMWRDIFLSNRTAMLQEIQALNTVLQEAEQALSRQDGQALQSLLERAAGARRAWGGERSE